MQEQTKNPRDDESPGCVVLGLSNTRPWRAAADAAMVRARGLGEGASVLMVFVIESPQIQGLSERLTGEGWITPAGTEGLQRALSEEAALQGSHVLEAVTALAREAELPLGARSIEGDFVEVLLKQASQPGVEALVVPRRDRLAVSRLLFGSPVAELAHRAPVPVEIVGD